MGCGLSNTILLISGLIRRIGKALDRDVEKDIVYLRSGHGKSTRREWTAHTVCTPLMSV